MTRFGMVEADFAEFAALFAAAVRGESVGPEVAAFRRRFQELRFCFTGGDFAALQERLAATF